jgi:class 3 adenylate cyclase
LGELLKWDKTDGHRCYLSNISAYQPLLTTIVLFCFVLISGFTSWSSGREPSQVFILLETLFHEFDKIARRRNVFKVETIGDCYVAVSGIPVARKTHAGK